MTCGTPNAAAAVRNWSASALTPEKRSGSVDSSPEATAPGGIEGVAGDASFGAGVAATELGFAGGALAAAELGSGGALTVAAVSDIATGGGSADGVGVVDSVAGAAAEAGSGAA